MKKFKYQKISKTKKLDISTIITKKNFISFSSGFMSDIERKKTSNV